MNTFEILGRIRINNNIRRFARGNGRSMDAFRAMLKMKNDLDKSIERMNKIFNMDQEEMDRIGKQSTGLSTRLSIVDEEAFRHRVLGIHINAPNPYFERKFIMDHNPEEYKFDPGTWKKENSMLETCNEIGAETLRTENGTIIKNLKENYVCDRS